MIDKKVICLFVLFNSLLFGNYVNAAQNQIPQPVGDIYIQDFADVLSHRQEVELSGMGQRLDVGTTNQVAVLTVDTTGDMEMDEFANEAYRAYGLGTEEKNNGVLLVLAMEDRKIRIEVGYGLEGALPDGKTGRILDENAIPYLQNGQPDMAIMKTYAQLADEISGEYQGTEEPPAELPNWLLIAIIAVVLILDFTFLGGRLSYILLSLLSRGGRGPGGPRGGGGGSSGGGGAGRSW